MKKNELVKLFEEKYLKGTCFSTLKELEKDKTDFRVNIYRFTIKIELLGVWRGLQELLK